MTSSELPRLPQSQPRDFATTRWSVVVSAGDRSSPQSRRALESLCETYWYPLYAYVRRRVTDVNEAHDLTQAFFAELLDKNYVGDATPDRGRFRAFLLTALKHFLAKQWQRARAQKRGGGRAPLSFDFSSADSRLRIEPDGGLTAEQLYEQQWALALLDQTLSALEAEYASAEKGDQFRLLQPLLVGQPSDTGYREVAERLGMSEAAARKAVSRMRGRYRKLLREEIAETVSEPGEVDDEIRRLFAALSPH